MQFEEFNGNKLVEAEGGGSYYSDHYVEWLESQREQLIDRVKAMAGELSKKEAKDVAELVHQHMMDKTTDIQLVTEAISEYKKLYNHSCEMREQDQREIRELKEQLENEVKRLQAELTQNKHWLGNCHKEFEQMAEEVSKCLEHHCPHDKALGGVLKLVGSYRELKQELVRLKRPEIFRELEYAIERHAKATFAHEIAKEKAEIDQLLAKIAENYKEQS